jgi:ABC-type dipeptide/oligopeptide/nickel transport system permease subunit
MRRRLLRRPLAVAGLVVALAFVLIAIFAPVLAPYDPGASDFTAALRGPSAKHLFGTDELGRDVLSRLIWSARVSMEAGVFSTLLALVIAVPIGLVAGYYRGWIDPVISRVTDVLLAFPFLILAVGLAAIFGPSLANATIALCVASVPLLIRVARGEALALREEDFVRAAVANGAGDRRILGRHIMPNMASTLIVQATVLIPTAIIGEAVLSYLGVGVQPPTPSWGVMLVDGQNFISKEPRLVILPGLCIFLATLSFNLLGDGLRDMLDPRTRD